MPTTEKRNRFPYERYNNQKIPDSMIDLDESLRSVERRPPNLLTQAAANIPAPNTKRPGSDNDLVPNLKKQRT